MAGVMTRTGMNRKGAAPPGVLPVLQAVGQVVQRQRAANPVVLERRRDRADLLRQQALAYRVRDVLEVLEIHPTGEARLDAVLEWLGITRCGALIVDVNGEELPVLQGFTPGRWKPALVTVRTYPERWAAFGYGEQEFREGLENSEWAGLTGAGAPEGGTGTEYRMLKPKGACRA